MKLRQIIVLGTLLSIALCPPLSAQQVEISDLNLRAAIADALGIRRPAPITQTDMHRLTDLDVRDQGISNLMGLEFAINLTFLQLQANQIEDVSPLATLTRLTELHLGGNPIRNITPLANLTQLTVLRLNENWVIEDISPLASLTQLNWLDLDRNLILDINPLAGLSALTSLDLRGNRIIDVIPLANLTKLTVLRLSENQIVDINPLAHLTNLVALWLSDNRIADVTPLVNLTKLTELRLDNNRIEDISPLENLTNLEQLDTNNNPIFDPDSPLVDIPDPNLRAVVRGALNLPDGAPLTQVSMRQLTALNARKRQIESLSGLEYATNLTFLYLPNNRIEDINPLANHIKLTELDLSKNRIVDVSPLENLTQLEALEIQLNQIRDHSPLDALPLSHFIYDQTCEMQPLPLESRLENRNYPSIFARWSSSGWPPVINRPDLSDAENLALHDLRFSVRVFGLHLLKGHNEFTISGEVDKAIRQRDELLSLNPNKIHLFTLDVREAPLWRFPEDWPGWIRDEHGDIFIEWYQWLPEDDHGIMDFTHPVVQDIVVQQAIAVSKCGLYDGVMFDGWNENSCRLCAWDATSFRQFRSEEEEMRALAIIAQRIQAETRPNFLIMGNTNEDIAPITGPYLNGGFMETVVPHNKTGAVLEQQLNAVEDSLLWLEQNLREPRINALEGWVVPTEPLDSPTNLRWMRAFTTLSLTHSDGYVVYSESETFGHYWYHFWDADLGRPLGEKGRLYQDIDGLYIREFTNGWAVYNHSGTPQVVTLPEEAQGVASGRRNTEHALPNLDGEMYLRVAPKNPADVNEDGVVNIFDLTLVAQALSTGNGQGDVNGDGVINVFDLVMVAEALQ